MASAIQTAGAGVGDGAENGMSHRQGSASASPGALQPAGDLPPFFSIADLATRWRCSRGSVYNWLRGRKVLHFAPKGSKGRTLVPCATVVEIEKHLRIFR